MSHSISIVVPAYNEADNLPLLVFEIVKVLEKTPYAYEIIIVDDGSQDETLETIKRLQKECLHVGYISLTRNFGQQKALLAGIGMASGDCVVTMDADMQHPPAVIPKLIQLWEGGYDIVTTKREENIQTNYLKKKTSSFFYKIFNAISELKLADGSADFRLLDKKVKLLIDESEEDDLFLRGYINWTGFNRVEIKYTPNLRHAGESKYDLWRMIRLSLDGITSFSIKPLRLSGYLGSLISVLAFIYAGYAVYISLFTDKTVSGWTSLLISVLLIGGIQLIMVGILGEYIGRLFLQSKKRPQYVIREMLIKDSGARSQEGKTQVAEFQQSQNDHS